MLDPLVIWPSTQSTYGGLDASIAWRLARAFEDQMRQALAGGYKIVDRPGPGVLRLRAALTDIVLQRPGVESPGPLIPMANNILIRASEKVSGLNALEGQAAIEAELLDAQSHERLAAYVEKRSRFPCSPNQRQGFVGANFRLVQLLGKTVATTVG